MKRFFAPLFVFTLFLAAGCSKDSNTDNTVGWTGTYRSTTAPRNYINKIVISKVDNNNVQVQAQIDSASFVFTVATLQKVPVVNSSTIAINENGPINTISDSTFHFVGSGALSGNSLILSCSATNTSAPLDLKYLYFSGSK